MAEIVDSDLDVVGVGSGKKKRLFQQSSCEGSPPRLDLQQRRDRSRSRSSRGSERISVARERIRSARRLSKQKYGGYPLAKAIVDWD